MTKEDILATIQSWKVDGSMPEPEIISSIVAACQEIPSLKEHVLLKERQLIGGSGQIISEAKKQYEAIDRALEVCSAHLLFLKKNFSQKEDNSDLLF